MVGPTAGGWPHPQVVGPTRRVSLAPPQVVGPTAGRWPHPQVVGPTRRWLAPPAGGWPHRRWLAPPQVVGPTGSWWAQPQVRHRRWLAALQVVGPTASRRAPVRRPHCRCRAARLSGRPVRSGVFRCCILDPPRCGGRGVHVRSGSQSIHFASSAFHTFCADALRAENVDWPVYNGGPDGDHYSRLTQINRANVHRLQIAWRYDTGEAGRSRPTQQQDRRPHALRLHAHAESHRTRCGDGATALEVRLWRRAGRSPHVAWLTLPKAKVAASSPAS